MSNISRAAWVKLYKDLLRASNEFPQYNYRLFARRRVRDYFTANRNVTDAQTQKQLFEEGKQNLVVIKRQASIHSSYPHNKQVVDQPSPAHL